jgi:hypothetical protein
MSKSIIAAVTCLLLALGLPVLLAGKYKIKDLQIKPAREYATHQDFQGVIIGAYACESESKTSELFDSEKFQRKSILPVLLVIENENDFPISIREEDIFLVDKFGAKEPRISFVDVLLRLSFDKAPAHSSGEKQLLLERKVNKEMYLDFETKSFAQKEIPSGAVDFGVVFFPRPTGGQLQGYSLYFPTVVNKATGEKLIFFEFQLGGLAEK